MPNHTGKDEVTGVSDKEPETTNPRRAIVGAAVQKIRGKLPPPIGVIGQKGRHETNRDLKEGKTGVTAKLAGRAEVTSELKTRSKEEVSKQPATEGSHEEKKNKLALFLPTSDRAAEDRKMLSKVIGVVYPGHGNPSVPNMIGGFRAISATFAHFVWRFYDLGRYYLVHFPSADGLDHAVGRTSIPRRDHTAGFTVYRWSG